MHSFKQEMTAVLTRVMYFWSTKTIDHNNGGFYGELDFFGNPIPNSNKGIILNARLLWSLAKVSNHIQTKEYSILLQRSYSYIQKYFTDETDQGVFWELDFEGNPINTEKKAIAQAYALLGLSEYYVFSKEDSIKKKCIDLYLFIENYFYNKQENYYYNSIAATLEPSDATHKNLGTHLHLLEAYTSLYRFYKTDQLKSKIQNLFEILMSRFLNNDSFCELDFDENWNSLTQNISIGHNAEVPLMLLDFSKAIGNHNYTQELISKLESYLSTSMDLIDKIGGVYMSQNLETKDYTEEFQWWMQTETILAFQKLYEYTNNNKYLDYQSKLWKFTTANFIDKENGEWYEKLSEDKQPIIVPKVAMWKAPYHLVRMCTAFI